MPFNIAKWGGRGMGFFMGFVACIPCLGQPPTTEPTEAARARRIVRDLAEPDPQTRRLATLQLNSLGADAMPVIEDAAKNDPTPERQRRLQQALKLLRPRAVIERRDAEIRNWEFKVFHDAYDHADHRGAAWDALAHKAIDLYLPLRDATPVSAAKRDVVLAAFRQAVDAGCDDPMILALYKLTYGGAPETHQGPVDRALGNLVRDIENEKYPAPVVLRVWADYLTDLQQRGMPSRSHIVELLPELAKTPGITDQQLYIIVRRGFTALGVVPEMGGVSRQYIDQYQKLAPAKTGPLVLDAMLHLREAMLSVNFGSTWEGESQRLNDAMKLLTAAEKLDPTDARPRDNVPTIQYYLANGTPEQFEQAFRRAVELDPDNLKLYDRKMSYLSPGWRGDERQLVEFGQECLRTENWRGNIPFKLIEIHELLASHTSDTAQYFSRPEVWQDVFDVYEGHLANFPDDVKRRCEFAKYATRCGKWDIAHRQFQIVGDAFDPDVFASKTSYDYLRKKAARLATAGTQPQK